MLMTAKECEAHGLDFAAVHDSYWTQAGSIDEMNEILRNQFVKLYAEDNILEEFAMSLANIDCGKKGIQGRYVFIRLTGKQADGTYLPGNMGANQQYLTLCEVEVYSSSSYVGVTKYSLQRSLDGKRFIPILQNFVLLQRSYLS